MPDLILRQFLGHTIAARDLVGDAPVSMLDGLDARRVQQDQLCHLAPVFPL